MFNNQILSTRRVPSVLLTLANYLQSRVLTFGYHYQSQAMLSVARLVAHIEHSFFCLCFSFFPIVMLYFSFIGRILRINKCFVE